MDFYSDNESVFYIPYAGSDNDDAEETINDADELEYDISGGNEIRWDAYRKAWTRCLGQVKAIVRELYEPLVRDVVDKVDNAYAPEDNLPALPHHEIPAIALTNPSSDSSFLASVLSQISGHDDVDNIDGENRDPDSNPTLVAHLHPNECPNLTAAMKSVVSGFITSKLSTNFRSLASYDINLLEAWYVAQESKPKLVLLLHDFEQFEPSVIQDVIYICSLHIPALPLILLISLSSPQVPSYLHIAYPRSTLALLQLHRVVTPTGVEVLEEVVTQTFINPTFDPDIVFGPAMLEFLMEHATRYEASVDAILNVLQLAHLKHILTNPLAALVHTTPSLKTLEEPSSEAFVQGLSARQQRENSSKPSPPLADIIEIVDSVRVDFHVRARSVRIGHNVLRLLHEFLLERGYKGLGPHWGAPASGISAATSASAPGASVTPTPRIRTFLSLLEADKRAEDDISYVRRLIRKFKPQQLREYLDGLLGYLRDMPVHVQEEHQEELDELEGFRRDAGDGSNLIGEGEEDVADDDAKMKTLAENLADWMFDWLMDLTCPLDDLELWDIWYTGMTPFPSETLNPSIRASIFAGLLRPQDFADPTSHTHPGSSSDEDDSDALWSLPDTSILFHRYLESGKLINVYDWYESFAGVLDVARREQESGKAGVKVSGKFGKGGRSSPTKKSPAKKGRNSSKSPTKVNGKGKGKQREEELEEAEEEAAEKDGDAFMDDEKYKLLVQARFIRALHELDFIGFIKHTKRKPDHVMRTVFEVPE